MRRLSLTFSVLGMLLCSVTSRAGIALDAITTTVAATSSPGTTLTSSTVITVGAGATLLLGMLTCAPSGATAGPTSPSMTWNASQTMTLEVSNTYTGTSQPAFSAIFRLESPTSGAQALASAWTNSNYCYEGAISFKATDLIRGVLSADSTSTGSTGTASALKVNADVNGATVYVYCNISSSPVTNFNVIWQYQAFTPGAIATYVLGNPDASGANTGIFQKANSSTFQSVVAVHVIAPVTSFGGGGMGGNAGSGGTAGMGD